MSPSGFLPRSLRRFPDEEASGHGWRRGRFPTLMLRRIQRVLLVSSPYDAFILEEDGLLTELIYAEYLDLGLTHAPIITRVSTGEEALESIRTQPCDLVITLLRLGDMDVARFADAVRRIRPELPVVLLVANDWELARLTQHGRPRNIDGIYVWHGDTKVFLAIVKVIEDRINVERDVRVGDVGVIILVEDSVRFRSSLLPIIYSQLVQQTRAVMADSLNHMDKLLRLTARPKVLVAETFEQGIDLFDRFAPNLSGVICDVSFPRNGVEDMRAGIDFIRQIKASLPDVPALLQSSDESNRARAEEIGARFLHKRSTTLFEDVQQFMVENFGFGAFVFRMPDGSEVARAGDLRSMAEVLAWVPLESIEYHARNNHFSNWLRARTEFALARRLRPRRVSEFGDLENLRRYIIRSIQDTMRANRRGVVEDFDPERFDAGVGFARIGGGSLGGKARGLAFVDALLARATLDQEFPGIQIRVPRSVVIGTDLFDEFLRANELRPDTLAGCDDATIARRFREAVLPETVREDLEAFLQTVRDPIAVRSSSLLEDSQYHPFAGVYATHMLPNADPDGGVRLAQLQDAIKLVYASVFFGPARRYLEATPHRFDEEKMAVVLQPVVGARHGEVFYPSFSGVVRSYNYYPLEPMKPEDGVASVALGLGRIVVDGGATLRFCPAYPRVLPELALGEDFINQSQRRFHAIALHCREPLDYARDACIVELDLADAERHGTLQLVGSVWSSDEQRFSDGVHRPGVRVVTFAHILKNDAFPLAAILRRLLEIGRMGMNGPVEIEFAANLDSEPREFAVLQIRPCQGGIGDDEIDLGDLCPDELLCRSPRALGHGLVVNLRDVVYVKPTTFDPMHSPSIAHQIAEFNARLLAENRPYVLLGPGRWGSSHASLGVPVNWSQICAARIIVETTLDDFLVEPSQGSHFFQNLTSFGIAYLTINPFSNEGFVDWQWLDSLPAMGETAFVRHVRLEQPLEARLNGERSEGAILKAARLPGPE